jgi:hypothetical protein
MDPIQLWIISLIIGSIVIVVVAVLLGAILAAAKSIDHHARLIWTVGKEIAGNTVTIWVLDTIRQRSDHTHDAVKKLDKTAQSINATLQRHGSSR